ncbi:tRNA pseudouridine(13) synthase TruD [Candidatus Woesearchaeota archaeon CG10_big_fil_rev_8_21_14_0_10_37_12]|nr:MAG: tRNA pseudouridine(13) synthase TruD [Candidatus Woesearchaeota archaeon CG10_big_fil_rev_8_21_14_0_10_37_12]
MKLRQKPEDFIVEEIPSKELKSSGKFAVYKLSKVNMTTFAAEKVLARHCNVKFNKIGFAGLKDTHARTTQYFSVETNKPECGTFKEQNVISQIVGFFDEKIRTGDLAGNKFIITVRELSEKDVKIAKKNLSFVKAGVPNYFDSQRFGSLKGVKGFIAKDILLNDYESAVKKAITPIYRKQKSQIKIINKFLLAHWRKWNLCLTEIEKYGLEKTAQGTIISFLSEHPQDFKTAFQKLFKGIREIFFSAYQSYIWNECVRQVIKNATQKNIGIPYEAGILTFPQSNVNLIGKEFPLLAASMQTTEENMKIIQNILKKENMALDKFKTDEHVLVPRLRKIFVVPENLFVEFEDDERNEGKKKAIVSFNLPKGSYATIVLKGLFEE